MNFADFSLRKSTIMWLLTILIAISGIWAYGKLGKLEDPSFTIKTAAISTPYPGASPREVEEEVIPHRISGPEARADRQGQVAVEKGLSLCTWTSRISTAKDLPQIWDELRSKITDVQSSLPPGSGPSVVNDDYGDVYGVYFALTGEGYSFRELRSRGFPAAGTPSRPRGGQRGYVAYPAGDYLPGSDRRRWPPSNINGRCSTSSRRRISTGAGSARVGPEYLRIAPTGYFVP